MDRRLNTADTMKDDSEQKQLIKNKLCHVLESRINTPEKVVYLLVEIRKFHELIGDNKPMLDFYRDWVVHAKLDRNSTIIDFLDKLEPYVTKGASGNSIATSFINNEPDFFTLDTLKRELEIFLSKNTMPSNLTNEHNCWKTFIKILLEVLKESTIEPEKPKKRIIKKLSLVNGRNGKPAFKFNLNIRVRPPMVKLTL